MPLAGKELEAFLQEAHLAHFATSGPDGKPRVRPIWFCYSDGAFWFTTRLEARRTGADVANGSPVAVSIANEDLQAKLGCHRRGRSCHSTGARRARRVGVHVKYQLSQRNTS